MAVVMLTEANIEALIVIAQRLLPKAEKSNIAMAVTMALKAKSTAHLTAATRWHGGFPDLAFFDNTIFRNVMIAQGEEIRADYSPDRLTREAVPHRLFLECRRPDREQQNEHYWQCHKMGWPLITVYRGTKFSEVQWDYITMAGDDFPFWDGKAGEQYLEEVMNTYVLFASGNSPSSLFRGNCHTGSITKLNPETALDLAEFMFEAMYVPMRDMHISAMKVDV